MHNAARYGRADIARLLLDSGANVKAAGRDGDTPLHNAVRNGHADIAELLLEGGADVNAVDGAGNTPLHEAARYGRADMVVLLLGAGADCDAQTRDRYTPITLALDRAWMSRDWETIRENIAEGNIGNMDAGGYPGVVANLVQTGANLRSGSPPRSYGARGARDQLRDLRDNKNAPSLFK